MRGLRSRRIVVIASQVALVYAIAFGAFWAINAHAPLPSLEGCSRLQVGSVTTAYQQRCYRTHISRLASTGPDGVARIDRAALRDHTLLTSCHNQMHVHGRRAGRRLDDPDDAARFLARLPDRPATCASGYLHGVVEGALARSGDADARVVGELLCGTREVPFTRSVCEHGLGHALALREITRGTDELAAVRVAVASCDDLDERSGNECRSAMAMSLVEGVDFTGGPAVRRIRRASDARRFCREHGAPGWLCLRYVPFVLHYEDRHVELDDVVELCHSLDGRDALACALGVGRVSVGTQYGDRCSRLDGADSARACWYGAAVAVLVNDRPTLSSFVRTCRAASGARREGCLLALGRWQEMEPGWRRPCEADGVVDARDRVTCEAGTQLAGIAIDGDPAELELLGRSA